MRHLQGSENAVSGWREVEHEQVPGGLSAERPAGDGILAALQVMQAAVLEGKSLAELCQGFDPLPSVLRNVPVASPRRVVGELDACGALGEAKSAIGSSGRLLVRPSGTEDLVRILVEGPDADFNCSLADQLVEKVRAA